MQDLIVRHLPDLALAAALAWGAGLRLYLTAFLFGLAGAFGGYPLPEHLQVLSHPLVLAASGFMAFVELFADKLPWLDSVWDIAHTAIRIPAGAALAAAVFGDAGAAATAAAALLGGSLSAATHLAKAGSRALVNTSPEPFSNVAMSMTEEATLIGGLWLASQHPLVFLALLAVFLVAALLMVGLVLRGIRQLFSRSAPAAYPPADRAQ